MFGSQVLDIAIGLVLVFLLMSIVLTAVQESIEAWLRTRAGDLNRSLYELLQNDAELLKKFYNHPLVFALHQAGLGSNASVKAVVRHLDTPRKIAALTMLGQTKAGANDAANVGQEQNAPETAADEAKTNVAAPSRRQARLARRTLPSYIPREIFSAALYDLYKQGQVRNSQIDAAIAGLKRIAGDDTARILTQLEGWYDGAMDRASGWYKRRTQFFLFFLGLAAALLLNINAIVIARHLATDQQARDYASHYAEQITAPGKSAPGADQIAGFQKELQDKVGLPIGWNETTYKKLRAIDAYEFGWKNWSLQSTLAGFFLFLAVVLGYLIPAFAGMLGAPFWFDVLNRIMVIRSTVKPKEKSPDEPSEAGGKAQADSRPAGAGPPATGAQGGDGEADLDGCLSEVALSQDVVTRDVDLPPATGGLASA